MKNIFFFLFFLILISCKNEIQLEDRKGFIDPEENIVLSCPLQQFSFEGIQSSDNVYYLKREDLILNFIPSNKPEDLHPVELKINDTKVASIKNFSEPFLVDDETINKLQLYELHEIKISYPDNPSCNISKTVIIECADDLNFIAPNSCGSCGGDTPVYSEDIHGCVGCPDGYYAENDTCKQDCTEDAVEVCSANNGTGAMVIECLPDGRQGTPGECIITTCNNQYHIIVDNACVPRPCPISGFEIEGGISIGNKTLITPDPIMLFFSFEPGFQKGDETYLEVTIDNSLFGYVDILSNPYHVINDPLSELQLYNPTDYSLVVSDPGNPLCIFEKTFSIACPQEQIFIEPNSCGACPGNQIKIGNNTCGCENGAIDETCTICPEDLILANDTCVPCPGNQVKVDNNTCICENGAVDETCTICPEDLILADDTCISCPGNQVKVDNSTCSCENGAIDEECVQCPENQYLIEGICGTCEEGTTYDPGTGTCVAFSCPDYSAYSTELYNQWPGQNPVNIFEGDSEIFIKISPDTSPVNTFYTGENIFSANPNETGVYRGNLGSLASGNYTLYIKDVDDCIISQVNFAVTQGTSNEVEIVRNAALSNINDMYDYSILTGFVDSAEDRVHDQHLPLIVNFSDISNEEFDRIISAKIVVVMRWWDTSNTEGLTINGVLFGNPCYTIDGCGGNTRSRTDWINWNSTSLLNGALSAFELDTGFDIRRYFNGHMWSTALRNAGLKGSTNAVCEETDQNLCSFEFNLQEMLDDLAPGKTPNIGNAQITIKKLLDAKGDKTFYINVADDTMVHSFEIVLTLSQ